MTVLFIHGAGCTSTAFQKQEGAFADAVTITLPGRSDLAAQHPSSIAEFAGFIDDLVGERSLNGVVLCGHSMGGAVALELALRRQSWLLGVVMLASGARLRVAPTIFERLETDFEGLAHDLAINYYFADPRPEWTQPLIRSMVDDVGQEQTLRDFHACDAFDVLRRLDEVSVPFLALTGDRDRMTPLKYASAIADRVPHAQARIILGAGHFVMVERPEETNAAIAAFISGIP